MLIVGYGSGQGEGQGGLSKNNRDCFISDYANLISKYKYNFENKKRRNSEGLPKNVVFYIVFEIEDILYFVIKIDFILIKTSTRYKH